MNILLLSLLLIFHVKNVQSAFSTLPPLEIDDLMSPVFASDLPCSMNNFLPFNSGNIDVQLQDLKTSEEQLEMFMSIDQEDQLVTEPGKFPKKRKREVTRRIRTVVQEEPLTKISQDFFKKLPPEKLEKFKKQLQDLVKKQKVAETAALVSELGIFYCNFNDSLLCRRSDITYERFETAIKTFKLAAEMVASAFLDTPFSDKVPTDEFSRNVLAIIRNYSEKDWKKRVSEIDQESEA